MTYSVPFYAMQSALYKVLSKNSDIKWFDSGATIEEIADFYKNQTEFAYGILGAADADCQENKDTVIWEMSLDLEIYSNYKGRKVITQQLSSLLNEFCDSAQFTALNDELNTAGFKLIKLTVGALRVNLPIYGDNGIWQSGGTSLRFTVGQKE